MPKFAANLSFLYNELPFLDRFEAAAKDGFKAVEYLFPYEWSEADLAARLRDNGLQQVLFNAPPGDWDGGERGIACLPGREADFRAGVHKALRYAEALSCPRVHIMAGLVPETVERDTLQPTYIANLHWAAVEAAKQGIGLLIEPINTRDIPRFFLNRQDHAHAIIDEVGALNLQVQMDLYHCQIVEGDVAMKLRKYLPTGRVGHLQIASVPERNEPDRGELNYAYLFALIDELSVDGGWDGWLGCEYRPRTTAHEGLGWTQSMKVAA